MARVHLWREFYNTYVENDYEAAWAANARALQLGPMDLGLRIREATVRLIFGDYAEAEAFLAPLLVTAPEGPEAAILHVAHADVLGRSGRLDEPVVAIEKAVELSPVVGWTAIRGLFHAAQGGVGVARDVLLDLEARSQEGHVSRFWLAVVHAALGDLDAACSLLESARDDRDGNILLAFVAPRLVGWPGDPRFPGFLRSIGLGHLTAEL